MSTGGKLIALQGLKQAPRSAPRSRMDTMLITQDSVAKWRVPDFQRPLKVNQKVRDLAEALKTNGGVIEGVITLGIYDDNWYIVDGQHRLEAYRLSELKEGLVDVRIVEFDTIAEMADEFARLNDHIVRMAPDDKLRAMEKSNDALALIRSKCRFVGYGQIRRNPNTPILSMSMVLRMWDASSKEVPIAHGAVTDLARELAKDEAGAMADYLLTVYGAWGIDPEYARLWSSLNLTLMAWLWRRMVTGRYSATSTKLSKDEFIRCCMALSASGPYLDWLVGRKCHPRDLSPCYTRVKTLIVARLAQEGHAKVRMPQPSWASTGSVNRAGAVKL